MPSQIKARRHMLGLTLAELAEAIGTTPQTVHRLERDDVSITVEWVEKLAKALNCHPSYLVGWDSPPDLPEDEADLLKAYRMTDPTMKQSSLGLLASMGYQVAASLGRNKEAIATLKTIAQKYTEFENKESEDQS
ncbi:MAG: helix-turn-helix transcriptional regulator [Rhodospirillales bacterium]|nr:helix-turn-helix transcriptional regulator [Rhodospirillales bacterium]MBR9819064.1 helix-turn-helix transcriptional regulator [Rhodospirillales bacterium]